MADGGTDAGASAPAGAAPDDQHVGDRREVVAEAAEALRHDRHRRGIAIAILEHLRVALVQGVHLRQPDRHPLVRIGDLRPRGRVGERIALRPVRAARVEHRSLVRLCARFALEIQPDSVPELVARFGLVFPGEPL